MMGENLGIVGVVFLPHFAFRLAPLFQRLRGIDAKQTNQLICSLRNSELQFEELICRLHWGIHGFWGVRE